MTFDSSDQHKYEEIPERQWREEDIRKLQVCDLENLFSCLPSIMYSGALSGSWKVQFAEELLANTIDRQQRARVWYGLSICARVCPQSDFRFATDAAWNLIDQFGNNDPSNCELARSQIFLDDLRTFSRNESDDSVYDRLNSRSASRYEVFTSIRSVCSCGDIQKAGQLSVQLSTHSDFVYRESGVYGICALYSRADCNPGSLKSLRPEFIRLLKETKSDVHWYVRNTNETARFFQDLFDQEYSSSE